MLLGRCLLSGPGGGRQSPRPPPRLSSSEFGGREDHEELLNSVLRQSLDYELHHELSNTQIHDDLLNLGNHGVLLHETLMSAVLGENRRDHDVQRHESPLSSVLRRMTPS